MKAIFVGLSIFLVVLALAVAATWMEVSAPISSLTQAGRETLPNSAGPEYVADWQNLQLDSPRESQFPLTGQACLPRRSEAKAGNLQPIHSAQPDYVADWQRLMSELGRPSSEAPQMKPEPSSFLALLDAAERQSEPEGRTEVIERAIALLSEGELPAMLGFLAQESGSAALDARQLLLRRWAENDAPAAGGWVASLPEGPARSAAAEQVAIVWANTDLPAATEWAGALSDAQSKAAAVIAVGYEAARSDALAALRAGAALPPSAERDALLVHAMSQWAGTDPASATDWAVQVADPALRQSLVGAAAVAAAKQDGAASAALAASAMTAGEEQDRTAVAIVQRWTQSSPQAAAAWVAQFPATPGREAALKIVQAFEP